MAVFCDGDREHKYTEWAECRVFGVKCGATGTGHWTLKG